MGNWAQFGTDEEARNFVTRLGNQALLLASDNSAKGSDGFDSKKPTFASSPYHFTKMVAAEDEWTAERVNQRQAAMAAIASKTWKV